MVEKIDEVPMDWSGMWFVSVFCEQSFDFRFSLECRLLPSVVVG